MKRVVKSFFIFLLIFAVVNVNALNIGDQFSVSIRQGSTIHSSSYQFNQYYQLESATSGGKTYDAYCMDRGNDPSGGRYVGRLLNKFKGDYAVLYILNNGSSDEEIHLAIRALVSKGILDWGSTANATTDYLAQLDAKVNCMKSDSTFSSTLTEFLSTSSKKNDNSNNNSDEGGKSIALLGFDKYNLLDNSNYTYYNCKKCNTVILGRGEDTGLISTFLTPKQAADIRAEYPECGSLVDATKAIPPQCYFENGLGWISIWTTEINGCYAYGDSSYNSLSPVYNDCQEIKASGCTGIPSDICTNFGNCKISNGTCVYKTTNSNSSCNTSKGQYSQSECNSRVNAGQGTECQKVSLFSSCYKLVTKCVKAKNQYSQKECLQRKDKGQGITCKQVGNNCFQLITGSSNNGDNGNTGGNAGTGGTSGGGTSVSCGGWDNIKQLLIDAMNYANEKFNSEGGESKVEKGPATEPEKADGVIKKIVSVKIDINNITDTSSDSEYFKYLGFDVEKENDSTEVKLLGASKEFINTEDGWKESISEGDDLSKKLDERKGTIYVGFLVSRPSSDDSQEVSDDNSEEEDCNVKIKLKYEQSSAEGGAVLYGYTNVSQRYFIATEGEPIQDEFELYVELCDETTCDPTSTLPTICEDGLEPDKETGNVEYEFREAYNAESGKYNIKKCLLSKNSEDAAGNKYKLIDNEYADMVSDNDYCEVKCKEDYIFGVPYKKSTESGRYFQISVSLKGQQDCYTTKLDYKKYTEDIVKKQAEIIDTYNEWLENYENYTFELVEGDGVNCTADSCSDPDENGDCSDVPKKPKDHRKKIKHSRDFYSYEIKEDKDKWTISAQTGADAPNGDPQFGEWEDTTKCSSCKVDGKCDWKKGKTPAEDYADKKDGYKDAAQAAKQTLKTLLEDLRQIVDKYNSCAADHDYASKQADKSEAYGETAFWDMIYRYNPDIQYSYEEPEPGISSTRWISSVQSESCEHGMNCDFMYSPDALVEAEKCADTTGGKVTCSENTSIQDVDDDTHVSTWYCDGNIDIEYEQCEGSTTLEYDDEYHWMVLDEDLDTDIGGIVHIGNNLENSLHKITKVDYVHKIASSKGTYKTERVYYSGHDDGDIKIEGTPEHEIENYDIVDGLPVGINTPTGTYYYKLTLNNFGTFYSDVNTNGRIYGNIPNKSLSSVIRDSATTKNNDEVNSNEYACIYEVNQNFCTDSSGNKHYKTECDPNEDWDKCQADLCGSSGGGPYCVEKSQHYYKCNNKYYDESCESVGSGSREETLLAVGCQPGEVCENNYNCCPNCTVTCVGACTVTPSGGKNNENKPNYDFRPVSPGNLFPNDRDIGFNWESDNIYNNSLVARKAKDTIDEITARAKDTSSAETPSESGNSKVEDYSLKVVMDSNMITKIREYNKAQESYNNDTMTCYDYQIDRDEGGCKKAGYTWKKEGDSGKCVMANIFCYSSFIDDLADGKFGGEVDIKNGDARTRDKEKFSPGRYTPQPAIEGFNSDNIIVTNDYWTIYTFSSLDINGDGIPDVGPSWK